MSKRGIGYTVFGNPKSFEAKGVGLFNQIPNLASELYLGNSDFSLRPGEQVDALIAMQVPEFGPVCVWGRWAPAKGIDSERSGGWRGAAVIVSGMQPHWGRASAHLADLFQQITAQCDAEGRFRSGKDNWQIQFPELVESDLGSTPLGKVDDNVERAAVALHGQGHSVHAVELAMSSLGDGVPSKWFFAPSESVDFARNNGAQFKAVLALPGLMRHFLTEMEKARKDAQQKGLDIQKAEQELAKRENHLQAREDEIHRREDRVRLWDSQESQRQSQLAEWQKQSDAYQVQLQAAQHNLDQLRQRGGPAKQDLIERENKGRKLGERDGRAQERRVWIPRFRVAIAAIAVLFLGSGTLGVLYSLELKKEPEVIVREPKKPVPPRPKRPKLTETVKELKKWKRSPASAKPQEVQAQAQVWRGLVEKLEGQLKAEHQLELDALNHLRLLFRYEKPDAGGQFPLAQAFQDLPDSSNGEPLKKLVNELLDQIHSEQGLKEGQYTKSISLEIAKGKDDETFEDYQQRIVSNQEVRKALKSWGLPPDLEDLWVWEYCQLFNPNDTDEVKWEGRKGQSVKGFALVSWRSKK